MSDVHDLPLGAADARTRQRVRLANGRVGFLIWWPGLQKGRLSKGTKARVQFSNGAVVSVPPDQLTRATGPKERCRRCGGRGVVPRRRPADLGDYRFYDERKPPVHCIDCDGTGLRREEKT